LDSTLFKPIHKLRNTYRPIAKELEKDIILKAQAGDKKSRDLLVNSNMGLVIKEARKQAGRKLDINDLVQVGAMALLETIDKFDTSKDLKFITYAKWLVVSRMQRYRAAQSGIVHYDTDKTRQEGYGAKRSDQSLNEIYSNSKKNDIEGDVEYQDLLVCDEPTPEDNAIRSQTNGEVALFMDNLQKTLTPMEKEFIPRIGEKEKNRVPLHEIGKKYGYCRESVRQKEAKLVACLANDLKEYA